MENIAIICGGFSGESVISIKSAKFVSDNLNPDKYKGYVIVIERMNWYYIDSNSQKYLVDKNDFSLNIDGVKIIFGKVFNIIHGDPGENGKMASYFDMIGIKSTSCSAEILSLTFNKALCNRVVGSYGVNIAKEIHIRRNEDYDIAEIMDTVGLPCFVKPNAGGSSIGMSKVKTLDELKPAIHRAFQEDDSVLIETFVEGRELTCGLIKSNGVMHVLPLCEVKSKKEYFDYEAKYDPELAEEIIPAPVDEETELTIKNLSVSIYNKLDCRGVVRMDYIVTADNVYFLEVNTIPGMSSASIVPQMARAYGWTNKELIDRILDEVN